MLPTSVFGTSVVSFPFIGISIHIGFGTAEVDEKPESDDRMDFSDADMGIVTHEDGSFSEV